jgi:hypothetical protein
MDHPNNRIEIEFVFYDLSALLDAFGVNLAMQAFQF